MKMLSAGFLIGIALAAAPVAASACTVMIPPKERIAHGRESGTISTVAIVSIDSARHTKPAFADAHPWQAEARVTKVVSGSKPPAKVTFERGWGSSACEWNLPDLPAKGDQWVVYYWVDRSGKFRPWLTMPIGEARRYDRLIPAG